MFIKAAATYWIGVYRSGSAKKFLWYSDNAEMSSTDGTITGSVVPWASGWPTDNYIYYRSYWSGTDKKLYDSDYWVERYFVCEHRSMLQFLRIYKFTCSIFLQTMHFHFVIL